MDTMAGRICAEGITRKQVFIEFYGVKGGITKEGFGGYQGMSTEIILKRRDQKPCIVDRFIFVR